MRIGFRRRFSLLTWDCWREIRLVGNKNGKGKACAAELVCVSGVLGGGFMVHVHAGMCGERIEGETGKGKSLVSSFLFFPSMVHFHPRSSMFIPSYLISMLSLVFLTYQPPMTKFFGMFHFPMAPVPRGFRQTKGEKEQCVSKHPPFSSPSPFSPSMMYHSPLIERQVRASGTEAIHLDTGCLLALLAADYVIIYLGIAAVSMAMTKLEKT